MNILEITSSICGDYALAGTLSIVHTVLSIICLLVPILLALMASIKLATYVMNPDQKQGLKPIFLQFAAAILVFFLPTLVDIGLGFLPDDEFSIAACWSYAEESNDEIAATTYKSGAIGSKGGSLMKGLKELSTYKDKPNSTSANYTAGTTPKGGLTIPLYYQQDYPDVYLNAGAGRTIASSGCGFTSVAMIVSYLTGKTITPREMIADWSRAYYVLGAGMSWDFPAAAAKKYNLKVTEVASINQAMTALQQGKPVLNSQGAGLFTSAGHLIVLRGVVNGHILVNDPNKSNAVGKGYTDRLFTPSEVSASSQKYWVFEK